MPHEKGHPYPTIEDPDDYTWYAEETGITLQNTYYPNPADYVELDETIDGYDFPYDHVLDEDILGEDEYWTETGEDEYSSLNTFISDLLGVSNEKLAELGELFGPQEGKRFTGAQRRIKSDYTSRQPTVDMQQRISQAGKTASTQRYMDSLMQASRESAYAASQASQKTPLGKPAITTDDLAEMIAGETKALGTKQKLPGASLGAISVRSRLA